MAKRVKVDWQAVELLYLTSPDEPSLRTLAERLGVTESAMMTRAHRGQWAAKRAAAKARASAPPASPDASDSVLSTDATGQGESGEGSEPHATKSERTPQKVKAGTLTVPEMAQKAATVKASRAETYEKLMAAQSERLPAIMAEMSDVELVTRAGDLDKLDKMNRRNLGLEGSQTVGKAPLVQIALLGNADRQTVKVVNPSESTSSDDAPV